MSDARGAAAPHGPEETRERLLNAALEVFLAKGYGGTRVQDIARRAGLTSGAIYAHFESRTALLGEALMREGNAGLAALTAMLQAAPSQDGVISELCADAITGDTRPFDRLVLEAVAAATRDDESRRALSHALDTFNSVIGDQITQARQRHALTDEVTDAAVQAFFLVVTLGSVAVRALDLPRAPADEMLDLMHHLMEGISAGDG